MSRNMPGGRTAGGWRGAIIETDDSASLESTALVAAQTACEGPADEIWGGMGEMWGDMGEIDLRGACRQE